MIKWNVQQLLDDLDHPQPSGPQVKADHRGNKDYRLSAVRFSPFVEAPFLKDDDMRRSSPLSHAGLCKGCTSGVDFS